jgi:hypothetical protein
VAARDVRWQPSGDRWPRKDRPGPLRSIALAGGITMQRLALPALLCASLAACLPGEPHSRDAHRTVDTIRKEHGWAATQIGKRVSAEELGRVRAGDDAAVDAAHRRLQKLEEALDRVIWVREAAPRALWASAEDAGDQDELAFRFARAGKLRGDAFAEADEIAEALATSPAPAALTWGDLSRALSMLQKAEASEEKVGKELAAVVAREPAVRGAASRLAPLPPPSPRPFVAAAAAYLRAHPAEQAQLDKLPKEAQADVERIRRALADQPAPPPIAEAPRADARSGEPPAAEPVRSGPQDSSEGERAAVRDRAAAAHAEADAAGKADPSGKADAGGKAAGGLLQIAGDARQMLTSRGLPRAFSRRADGTFALRYEEPRPCASGQGSCPTLVDYLFNEGGGLLREETVGPAEGAAPAPPPEQRDDE